MLLSEEGSCEGSYSLLGSHAIARDQVSHVQCNLVRNLSIPVDNFVLGEELGTEVSPKCGSCRCSRCPMPGHTYSFQEEQELKLIRSNLRYDQEGKRWITKYPWIIDPYTLPNNERSAMATLMHTERKLLKDETWAKVYDEQIMDMVDRGVAKVLSHEELDKWKGPVFYLSHLAVLNPKSSSTPVRIVFNSSQVFQGFSLNGSLAKGPDSYLNNLLGVLLRWREGPVAITADIRKMYNSIFIEELEQHCHRFLWRQLDFTRPPDVYAILRVNMGDKPAGAISTEAIYLTAEMFGEAFPEVASMLRRSTYVDDIVDSVSYKESAVKLAMDTNTVLQQAGFKIKHWLFSGDSSARLDPQVESQANHTSQISDVKVLGVSWRPVSDMIAYVPSLNFSTKQKGVYTQRDLVMEEIPESIPLNLSRRMVLEQTMKIYDPFGFLSPFTLVSKVLLRKTWALGLGWDDWLPSELREEWVRFFSELFDLSALEFPRSLTPNGRVTVGKPVLVIFSDGSEEAYGCCAYIRWTLEDGGFWSRLILAKCCIAPLRRISIPQMELNGAVISKRIRRVVENELRFSFQQVYHLVDSETILCMLNKVSTRFKVYEGVRIGEVQQATGGDLSEWFWVPSVHNISDWTTRGKSPSNIDSRSSWWCGPAFLGLPVEEWPIKPYKASTQASPGEKLVKSMMINTQKVAPKVELPVDVERYSCARTLVLSIARLISIGKKRSFRGWVSRLVDSDCLRTALELCIKYAQQGMEEELMKKSGKYSKLAPVKDGHGLWVVGSRFARYNPMTSPLSDHPQVLLPSEHWLTLLLMREAHADCSHRGRDSTLARFRLRFWITKGNCLSSKVVQECFRCRKQEPRLLGQQMGLIPSDRLKPAPPFTTVMLDLFGPYVIRGEVQERRSGKAYGVIFTDLFSRAVHIEGVFGYDTQSFIAALSRFACIRGWPQTIYSDCGTQIVAASNALHTIWNELDQSEIVSKSSVHGLRWVFGPPDSPWYQGAVESLVKSAKRAIHFSVGDKRMSASEFLTVCTRAANILNERPIGRLPAHYSEINILTPNCLLIGRPIADQPRDLN